MAYVALYRAYRPQKFSEVAGQKHIVKTLQNAIKLNRVAHAYLFCGPRGTGKTSIAKIMAKALNCAKGMNIEPCCECDICKGITKGSIADVVEIDAASNNGVDEIRDIRDKVKYLPSTCRYKVYIIDEVHMLTMGAFNALLKTLEEPPSHVVFILATTESQKIPATILSRCQRFDFLSIREEDIKNNLKRVIEKEGINVSNEALDIISEACDGGMRDALSLLDQSISYSSDDLVSADDVLAVSGNLSNNDMIDLVTYLKESNKEKVLEKINEIIKEGKEIPKIVSDIISFLRDILMFKNSFGDKAIYKNENFMNLANNLDDFLIYSWMNELNLVQNNIRTTNQKSAYLELGLIKMADIKIKNNIELEKRVSDLESMMVLSSNKKFNSEENIKKEKPITFDIKDKGIKKEDLNIEVDDSYITVSDISNILNNGNKDKKVAVNNAIINAKSSGKFDKLLSLYDNIEVVASNNNEALIVLDSDGLCNRLMRQKNYEEFMSMLNEYNANIDSFICISKDTWNIVSNDFKSKYKTNKKPVLNDIKILVKKYKKEEQKTDDLESIASELFPGMNIKIEN